eukprot:NODE_17227_length_193_cov_7.722222_g16313_i0.p3 GENE.NODE_17227_length_193_cov_7.722222_g16313_i0~~NODE_17227_length_193_cov_7.722222_g16313_i0.p3  ORF type:complete len:53 (-),score=5.44 NODE_17227_length_193_cov_7.722222_g16313_i0:35-193(-)
MFRTGILGCKISTNQFAERQCGKCNSWFFGSWKVQTIADLLYKLTYVEKLCL